jgi:tripartite motif-containing protein 71
MGHRMLQHRLRSAALVLAATLLGAAGTAAVAPQALAGPAVNPTPLSTLPTPFVSGHAGLYGWGAATMPDGSVIVGDYWNHRVIHYDVNGNPIGTGVAGCEVPGCLFALAATPAVYSAPYGLAVDPTTKAIYVGFECCAVEKFTLSKKGVYQKPSRILYSGFKYPSRVAVGKDGTLYVADMTVDKIFVFSSTGTFEKSWGSLGSGANQFNGPTGMALDQSTPQNLYVADPGNNRIDVINTSTGAFGTSFGSKSTLGANLRGLAIDATNGFLYVVDDSSGTIHQFSIPSGTYVKDIGAPWTLAQGNNGKTCCAPNGEFANGGREATVDGSGHLWVGDMPDYRVQVFDSSGNFLLSESGSPVGPPAGGFDGPHGVAIDPTTGNLIITDTFNFRVQEFTTAGALQLVQGIRDDVSTPYGLNYPMGVAVESDGSFLISDSYNQAIRKYDSSGNFVTTYTGTGTKGLNHAEGIALGAGGIIYVADYLKKRVVELQDSGTKITYIKTFGSGLKAPSGIAVDPTTGNVFVSDFSGPDVVEFNSAGTELMTIGGPGTSQPLQNPADIVLDGNYLYVSDSKANKVLVFDEATGALITSFGALGSGAGQFSVPIGLALNGAGDLYIADSGNDRISEWCVTGC